MTATPALTGALQQQVTVLEDDLRARVESLPEVRTAWTKEHAEALACKRTAASWQEWRDERVMQAAVAWVLTTVFVRFCEDNELVDPVWIAGPPDRRQEALDAQLAYFRAHPEHTDREWLEQAIGYLGRLPATASLVDGHSPLHLVSPSGDAAAALLAFWRERDEELALVHDLRDPSLSTRFLGDLYQDLSQHARDTYALLQTPEFVEEFILDRTLEPALAERPLEGFRMIDPACGSGHFLLGAFARLLDRWHKHAPGMERQARVQAALDAVHGVDVNPFAVAIARFRLTIAALKESGLRRLEKAPAFRFHLAVGDSLLHGSHQEALDFGAELDPDALLSRHTYSTEDLTALREILQTDRYDVVVGNPPYITAKDEASSKAYRERYPTSCNGQYHLSAPFTERFFNLAKQGERCGRIGLITDNAFMKREYGVKFIERFLAKRDLTGIIDTAGAYIPGHGTPTVILIGRNRPPSSQHIRVVLGLRGEPGRPSDPRRGRVWNDIVELIDQPGAETEYVKAVDYEREIFDRHPWTLGAGLEVRLRVGKEAKSTLSSAIDVIGRTTHTGVDPAFFLPAASPASRACAGDVVPVVLGEQVRDYTISPDTVTVFPYDENGEPRSITDKTLRLLWPNRGPLETALDFGQTRSQRGLRWFDHSMFFKARYRVPLSIAFAFVATHNHFVLDRGGKVFKQSAPVIKLPEGATEDDHLRLLGVLNSSTACFWLKQNSQNRGGTVDSSGARTTLAPWENFHEFTATTLQDFPLPATLPLARGRVLDSLAQELSRHTPAAVCEAGVPTRAALDAARAEHDRIRARMIAVQEELDWEVYRLYGLVDEDLTYAGDDLPGLALGERAFEIALARRVATGEEETAWFTRHGSTPITEIPAHWPAAYRDLVQRRLDLIANDKAIRLLEQPEYKRRWASEPWQKREKEALRDWLLDRLEDRRLWFDAQGRPRPRSVAQLADEVARDADLSGVLALWAGRPDVPVTDTLVTLLADQAVPFLAAHRYKESGLRKREAWEHTWDLQRREDRGEKLDSPIPVPPKYTSADFAKPAYWRHRGKLDVPKERFIGYPDAGLDTDPTPLLGWAGWDHAQQALALNVILQEREAEGWPDERLVPLVAGLAELQPWVDQWHADVDPAYGVSLAAFCAELLAERTVQVGMTTEELRRWRPAPARRGRRARSSGADR